MTKSQRRETKWILSAMMNWNCVKILLEIFNLLFVETLLRARERNNLILSIKEIWCGKKYIHYFKSKFFISVSVPVFWNYCFCQKEMRQIGAEVSFAFIFTLYW